jgi:anti-sigma B factor antagonist
MFSMHLGSGASGEHGVVALRGELDLMHSAAVAAALEAAVAAALEDVAPREPRIIVDLTALEFIDASGVAALLRGRSHARVAGCDLLLAAPQRQVRRVLAILWEVGGSVVHASVAAASVAAAAADAGVSRQLTVPIRRQPAKMRWQRIAMNASTSKRSAIAGSWLPGGSRAPWYQIPTSRTD